LRRSAPPPASAAFYRPGSEFVQWFRRFVARVLSRSSRLTTMHS